jgi:glycosyltransferase involved in cell wall biosynthesis
VRRLLVVSKYSDENFVSCDYVFVHNFLNALQIHFDQIDVISPTPHVPRILGGLGRVSNKMGELLAKRDYTQGKIRVFFARFPPWVGRLPEKQRTRAIWSAIESVIGRESFRPNLVHAHMTIHATYGLSLAKRFEVPSVVTIHDNHDWLMPRLNNSDSDLAHVLRSIDSLIRVSPLDIDEIKAAIDTQKAVHYLPNGFDRSIVPEEPRQAIRRDLQLPSDRTIFVSVARWVDRKDPYILLDALARLRERGQQPLPLICMIGGDATGGRVERQIEQLELGNYVFFLGQLLPREVMRYMRASDAVLLYSRSEGNPTVMFEALGCGRPYIGSDVGGVRAVLSDPRLGSFGPPGDLERLTELMAEACRTEWDEAFISDWAQRYTWDNIAQQTWDQVYTPLMD